MTRSNATIVFFLLPLVLFLTGIIWSDVPEKEPKVSQALWIAEELECPIDHEGPPWGFEDREPYTFKVGGVISEPIRISSGTLANEKFRECSGTVQVMPVIELVINRSGMVEAVALVKGERNCWLDELVRYYRTWEFEPAEKEDTPVCSNLIVSIRVGLQ